MLQCGVVPAGPAGCVRELLRHFAGSGTTLAVAVGLGYRAIGCELNPKYIKLIERRMRSVTPALVVA